MKFKKTALLLALVLCIGGLNGCGSSTEETYSDNVESVEDGTESEETEETVETDSRHHIGDSVDFESDDGGTIRVTLTDWGSADDGLGSSVLAVKYMIENTGTTSVRVGPGLFSVYADDYSIEQTYLNSEDSHTADLSGGRKMDGIFYAKINPNDAQVIEVECGGSVFVLKDGGDAVSDSGSRNVVSVDEDTSNTADIPADMRVDSEKIDYLALSGNYGGMQGMSSIDLSMYSSPEENSVGNADVYVQGGEYAYVGEISEVATNVYKVANTEGQEVLLAVSTEIAEYDTGENQDSGTLWIQLYVDGELIEEYMMLEHYES